MTYDAIVKIALKLEGVEESMSYGRPCVKRDGRFMFRLKEDGETIAVKMSWETHDRLIEERTDLFFKTPHYEGYPALLARCADLKSKEAKELVQASWQDAPRPGKKRRVVG